MPTVKFTRALRRFFPTLQDTPAEACTLTQVLDEMDEHYPGVKTYLLDEQGRLRRHVNIFVDGNMIVDRDTLGDALHEGSEVYIIQALSGG
ncbi:MAG TPA: MoaD/ThiS family protein [Panacibacter sp.]|nr:MoaD/ThiS family protein [Panacibacter sp.]HNP46589.1 MoaD/ThiS family protein [Panacibacter sp.]